MDGDPLRPVQPVDLQAQDLLDHAADVHDGAPFFDWISQYPEQVSQFTGAMANLTNGIKAGAVAAYDFEGAGEIVDIGGADGAVLI